jgi:Xaa-Pro aminopeptidase
MAAADTAVRATFLDVAGIQAALAAEQLDAWLLYDFRGLNPIAADVTGVARQEGHLATRRWFYLIPSHGEPRGLVHAIEPHSLAHLPGTMTRYARRRELEAGLAGLLQGVTRVAMEYSPGASIPYVSRVDAGTVDLVRQSGVEVVSSADLVQQFSAVWNETAIATHEQASAKIHHIKDLAFEAIAQQVRDGATATEYDIQQRMAGWFAEEGLVSDSEPNVSVGANAGNPHYLPTATSSSRIGPDDLVLIDLWAKLDVRGAVYADITWMGYTGGRVPDRFARAFAAVRDARDAAVTLVQQRVTDLRPVRGWEVDRAASTVLEAAGYGSRILHRTGHSLGESVHGTGVNMDDYETHDDRRLIPGTGFTIEPGIYFADFGIRSEINMIVRETAATVTGPLQHEILALGS